MLVATSRPTTQTRSESGTAMRMHARRQPASSCVSRNDNLSLKVA